MGVDRHPVGMTRGHAAQGPTRVEAFDLSCGDLDVTVWTYGASLVELRYPDRHGRADNVVVRCAGLSDYERVEGRAYLGATMGRYARCVANGRVTLDGRGFELERNEGANHVHGGPLGFDAFVWEVVAVVCEPERVAVRMRLRRPDGDQGYPGALTAETTYAIERGNTLVCEYVATTDAPTLCDLTNHAMWNLAGAGNIDDHFLAVNADRVLLVNEDLLPVGEPVPVEEAGLDLRSATPLAGRRLDNCFVLDRPGWAASLAHPASGRRMTIETDQPGLQIYSGDQFARPRAGVCLQAGSWPNAPVRPDYPSARLDPGQTYRARTAHRFERIEDDDA